MLSARSLLMPLMATFIISCGDTEVSNLSDESVNQEFYQGTTHTAGDDGQEATENMLLVRTTDSEQRTVRIDIRTWADDSDYINKNWLDINLGEPGEFTLTGDYLGEDIEGVGNYTGEAFGTWSAWNYNGHVSSDSDIRITSEAMVDAAGNVSGQALLFYGDGETPIVTITDSLTEKTLDDADFAALVSRLMAE